MSSLRAANRVMHQSTRFYGSVQARFHLMLVEHETLDIMEVIIYDCNLLSKSQVFYFKLSMLRLLVVERDIQFVIIALVQKSGIDLEANLESLRTEALSCATSDFVIDRLRPFEGGLRFRLFVADMPECKRLGITVTDIAQSRPKRLKEYHIDRAALTYVRSFIA